jgi:hypothetical protein
LQGKIGLAGIQGPDRRELVGEPPDHQLVEVLGLLDVLQSVRTQVAEAHAGWKDVLDEGPGRTRDEHLSAVAGSRDPCRPVDVQPDVVLAARDALAGVNAHPHPHLVALGPRVRRKGALCLDRGTERPWRGRKHGEEGVAVRLHLDAAGGGDGIAQDPVMYGEQVAVRLGGPLKQPRGPLDVREQEGYGPGRQYRHARPFGSNRRAWRGCRAGVTGFSEPLGSPAAT